MRFRPIGEMESNIGRYFLGRVLLALCGFLSIPLLIRVLGVGGYGQVSLWIVIAYWLPMLLGGWMQQSILRYHREYQLSGAYADYRSTREAALLRVAIACGLLTALVIPRISPVSVIEQALIGAMAAAAVVNIVGAALAQAEGDAARVVRGDLARTAAPLLLFAIHLALFGTLSHTAALAYFLAGLLLANWMLSNKGPEPTAPAGEFAAPILRRMLIFGLPMGLWLALSASQVLIGRFILQLWHLPQALGVYTALQDFFSKSGGILFMPVTYALHGQVMSLWAEKGYPSAQRAIHRAYLYQFLLSVTLLAAVFLGRHLLARVLFGANPQTGAMMEGPFLLLVTGAVILSNFSLIAHKGMEVGERTVTMAWMLLAAVAVNVLTSVLLMRIVGAWGVAYGMLIGNACYLAMAQVRSHRILRLAQGTA